MNHNEAQMIKIIVASLALALALSVGAVQAAPKSPPRPVVSDAQGYAQQPVHATQQVAQVQIKPGNTTDRIKGASAAYFAIDGSGAITVTPEGATAMNAQTDNVTYTLTVTATNNGGTGTGTVTVLVKIGVPVIPPNQSFTMTAPVSAGQQIGVVQASGTPTSWQITGATP